MQTINKIKFAVGSKLTVLLLYFFGMGEGENHRRLYGGARGGTGPPVEK